MILVSLIVWRRPCQLGTEWLCILGHSQQLPVSMPWHDFTILSSALILSSHHRTFPAHRPHVTLNSKGFNPPSQRAHHDERHLNLRVPTPHAVNWISRRYLLSNHVGPSQGYPSSSPQDPARPRSEAQGREPVHRHHVERPRYISPLPPP